MANAPYPRNFYDNIVKWVPSQQFVGKSGSAVDGNFEVGRSTWSEQWVVNSDDLQTLIENVIGYAMAGGAQAGNGVMTRYLPATSNEFPYMYASSIQRVEALAPTGKGMFEEARFKQWRATIQFETPPYNVYTDEQVFTNSSATRPPESQRYVVWNRQPAPEFARTPYNAWIYPPGTGASNAGDPLPGQNGQAILLTKYRITATWVQVPEAWISTNSGQTFANLDAATSTVNNAEFLGYPKGTLLFESYEPTPRVMPIPPGQIALNPGQTPRCYDVMLKWLYFDPQPVYTPGNPNDAARGHNLVYNPATNPGQWQRALKINTNTDVSANWFYREYDHTKIFKKAS